MEYIVWLSINNFKLSKKKLRSKKKCKKLYLKLYRFYKKTFQKNMRGRFFYSKIHAAIGYKFIMEYFDKWQNENKKWYKMPVKWQYTKVYK